MNVLAELDMFPEMEPEDNRQIIDLFDSRMPLEEKRAVAADWGNTPLWACRYCNGFDSECSPRFPAGEQV